MGEENSSQNNDAWNFKLPTLSWFMLRLEGMDNAWERQELLASTAAIVIVVCFCLTVVCKKKCRGKQRRGKIDFHRSLSMAALHGGKVSMQRILDAQHARVDASELSKAEARFMDLLAQDLPNFKELQSVAADLEMSGKEDKAVKMLRDAWEKARDAQQYHEAYELEMLLVEMLIYQGNYEEALKRKCMDDQQISDARRPLYKAVLYVILGDSGEAAESSTEFNEIRKQMHGTFYHGDDIQYEEARDFKKFEKTVKLLKQEIDHARMGTR